MNEPDLSGRDRVLDAAGADDIDLSAVLFMTGVKF
jgi:hypothetical protein